MGKLLQDIKHGARLLRKSPGFSLAAILVLALGIGANTAIFSVVNSVLLRPLPYRDAKRLVMVYHIPPPKSFPGMTRFAVSPANYVDWAAQNRVFERMAIFHFRSMNLTGGDHPENVIGAAVSKDFFSVLGVQPRLGRTVSPDEQQPGQANVVVLSHAFAVRHFGSGPKVVGKKLSFDGQTYTVIGVMPASFKYPDWAKVWIPLAWTPEERAIRGAHSYLVIARLKPGVSLKQANAEMQTISNRLASEYPADDAGWSAFALPLHEDMVEDIRPALLILLGAVGFVLLIACANVANLSLAKALGRRKEMAIRAALGASRGRVLHQVLAEMLLLSLTGGALGLLFAHFGVDLIVLVFGDKLPHSADIRLDVSVLLFTFVVAVLTGIVAGIVPALRLTNIDLNDAIKQGPERTGAEWSGKRTRSLLVISEVALSLILLIGAGLMVRSLWLLQNVNPGIDVHHVLTVPLALPQAKYSKPAQQRQFFERVIDRLRASPGVESVGGIDNLPLAGGADNWPVAVEGRPAVPVAEQPEVLTNIVTPGYFQTMKIPLYRGRLLSDRDNAEAPSVIVISESMVKQFWPNENPIGKHLVAGFIPGVTQQVVGVVGDVKHNGVDVSGAPSTMYLPFAQLTEHGPLLTLAIRTTVPPENLTRTVIQVVHQIDPEQPVEDIATMEHIAAESLAQRRFNMLLLASFAGLALLLAAVGIYSVLAYAVRRRTREIGLRMALGAEISDVLRMVVIEAMTPTVIGVAIGIAGAMALGKVLSRLIFGVSTSDAATFTAVSALLLLVALLASSLPAYRATKVDPMNALREE